MDLARTPYPRPTIGVVAQVPAEAACLATTVPSLRQLGDVVVFSADAGPEVTAAAAKQDAPVVPVPWNWHYGELFTAIAQRLGDGPAMLAYADETVAATGGDWWTQDGPVAAGVRHRTSAEDTYTEENEPRGWGPGAPARYDGLNYLRVHLNGTVVDPDDLPYSGVVFEHFPASWPELSRQRLARTAQLYRIRLDEAPADPDAIYGLFRCHYSAHDWAGMPELAERWRAVADRTDGRFPLVDYYEACALVAAGDKDGALRLAERSVAHAANFADGWYLCGELHAAAGRDADADAAFCRAAGIGRAATPVAVEDFSLATWRPLAARAALAKRAGNAAQARQLLADARMVRDRQRRPAHA